LGHSSAVVAVVFFVIEKTGSQVFFLPLTSVMRHYIVKMTFAQNALSTEDLIFIWFLANSETKFLILGEKTLYRAKTLYHDNVI
jgi:hypothetical protein